MQYAPKMAVDYCFNIVFLQPETRTIASLMFALYTIIKPSGHKLKIMHKTFCLSNTTVSFAAVPGHQYKGSHVSLVARVSYYS